MVRRLDYTPFLERDVDGIRTAIAAYRLEHSDDELWSEVARFAVLAFAPSQHSKHALIASLAAWDVRHDAGAAWPGIVTECAVYAALSRQPWSEPPILDPPHVEPDHPRGADELRSALASRDRLRGERWLAANLDDTALLRERLFAVAADDFGDLGHKLIIANAAWRLADLLGERGRYVTLRTAIVELCAEGAAPPEETAPPAGNAMEGDLGRRLVDAALSERGSIESMHRVFLYDAAVSTGTLGRAAAHLSSQLDPDVPRAEVPDSPVSPEPYALGRDYAAYLQAFAVAGRLGDRRLVAAARLNLEEGTSFEEWSFA